VNRVVHFEIHADDPERAMAFYKTLFGWAFQKYGGDAFDYWLVTTGDADAPGINGGLMRRMRKLPASSEPIPVVAFVCTIDVDDIDRVMEAAIQAGATRAMPKNAIPTVGWTAYMKDPEGNVFGLYQVDRNAK
jgi:uncharacterized protein